MDNSSPPKSIARSPAIRITKAASKRVNAGHPWIYRTDITDSADLRHLPEYSQTAVPITILSAQGQFVGYGMLNMRSMIAVRIMSRRMEVPITGELVRQRAAKALALRRPLLALENPATSAVRLIFAEADGLPGLIVDKMGPALVFQSLAAASEAMVKDALAVLLDSLSIKLVVERSDAPVRDLEGLPRQKGIWRESEFCHSDDSGRLTIIESGRKYLVDLHEGQKTGFYLDQRANRDLVTRICADLGKRVSGSQSSEGLAILDCFSYTGGFAVAAAHGAGAALQTVVCVDSSGLALELAQQNLALNSLEPSLEPEFVQANAFDYLRQLDQAVGSSRRTFDLIVLDPPPFAREKRMVPGALRGYKEINLRAMKLLRPGGYLVTCTCSHHIGREAFQQVLVEAAADARRTMRLVAATGQPQDHPVVLGYPEGDYLRCLVLQSIES